MKLLAFSIVLAAALVALPDSPVVDEANAIECIVNCYVCVQEPCHQPGPYDRVEEILRNAPLPCDVNPGSC